MHKDCWNSFKKFANSKDGSAHWAKKWKTLDNAYVNFSHFAWVNDGAAGWSFTKYGIFHAWHRHVAYFMGAQFPCIDLLISVAYASSDGTITADSMAFIAISVKNLSGKSKDSLKRQNIEEDLILRTPNVAGQYTKPEDRSTLLLSLRTLPFIYQGEGTKLAEDNANAHKWIELTENNPYIAFVMSIGSGDKIRVDQRFVSELQVSQSLQWN